MKRRRNQYEISPEEVLLDAQQTASLDTRRLDGRITQPIEDKSFVIIAVLLCLCAAIVLSRSWQLMITEGASYYDLAEKNRLGHSPVFAERGVIYDRNGTLLAWNEPHVEEDAHEYAEYSERVYASSSGFSHVLGYVRMPQRDTKGVYYQHDVEGVTGVESTFDQTLSGIAGTRIVETDARMALVSEGVLQAPIPGNDLHLTLDARLQNALHERIRDLADQVPFTGGAGIIMDVHTGELVAYTNYPEFNSNTLVSGDAASVGAFNSDARMPYLDRVVQGQYSPGSIVKPFMALAALHEGIIRPSTVIVSTGALRLPNPYHPGQYSIFRDWRVHGAIDLTGAIANSSDEYFYYIGGGFGNQEGLGIERINRYMRMFGFGSSTGASFTDEKAGNIPSPAWKEETFPNDPTWRVGNTYHTSIGQYGFLVTPLQSVRAIAGIATNGYLTTPRISLDETATTSERIDISLEDFAIVRAGMRQAVRSGTAIGLNVPYVDIAAKTGTAEIGTVDKNFVHSWVTGFFPYEHPRYAFTVVMEHGPRGNLIGATYVMRQMLDWMHEHAPEYFIEE